MALTENEIRQYHEQGYLVVHDLFDAATAQRMIDHYMAMRAEGPKPHDMGGDPTKPNDPLNKYPRMINMHNWDEQTLAWAQDAGLLEAVGQLIDDEPVLNQTMLYFKPPGGRGQAHHQDQQYITIDPLIGVWVALDPADAANGFMTLLPGSHKLGMLEAEAADISKSFTGGGAKMPEGAQELGIAMQPGDVLFFDGKTVHGSHPNVTTDRFRRSFICHFVGEHAVQFEPEQGTHMTHVVAK
jgi:ectoine hydroxylase-related dioxygenase (phytanoyl-CoA dioxygenase family)